MMGIKGNNNDAVNSLLLEKGINLNGQDNNGWSALHHAIAIGNMDIVQTLLKHNKNCDLNSKETNSAIEQLIEQCNAAKKQLTNITQFTENATAQIQYLNGISQKTQQYTNAQQNAPNKLEEDIRDLEKKIRDINLGSNTNSTVRDYKGNQLPPTIIDVLKRHDFEQYYAKTQELESYLKQSENSSQEIISSYKDRVGSCKRSVEGFMFSKIYFLEKESKSAEGFIPRLSTFIRNGEKVIDCFIGKGVALSQDVKYQYKKLYKKGLIKQDVDSLNIIKKQVELLKEQVENCEDQLLRQKKPRTTQFMSHEEVSKIVSIMRNINDLLDIIISYQKNGKIVINEQTFLSVVNTCTHNIDSIHNIKFDDTTMYKVNIFHIMCYLGDPDIITSLQQYPSIENMTYMATKEPLLKCAVISNNVKLVEEMVKLSSIDINKKDKQGMTALHYAIKLGYIECMQELIKKEIILDNNETAVHLVIKYFNEGAINEEQAQEILELFSNKQLEYYITCNTQGGEMSLDLLSPGDALYNQIKQYSITECEEQIQTLKYAIADLEEELEETQNSEEENNLYNFIKKVFCQEVAEYSKQRNYENIDDLIEEREEEMEEMEKKERIENKDALQEALDAFIGLNLERQGDDVECLQNDLEEKNGQLGDLQEQLKGFQQNIDAQMEVDPATSFKGNVIVIVLLLQ